MTKNELVEISNLLKDYYQFMCGTWSEKAEEEMMIRLRDKIEELDDLINKDDNFNQEEARNNARKTWGLL